MGRHTKTRPALRRPALRVRRGRCRRPNPRSRSRRPLPMLDLVPLWAGILALAVFMYVLLDGFDLGVGMLFLLRDSDHDRHLMMTSIAPVWDFNETWLVLGAGGLLAVFPLAIAIIV